MYAPAGGENEKITFASALSNCLDNLMSSPENFNCVVGGDLNVSLQPLLDSYNNNDSNVNYRKSILNICENLNLIDVWRIINPETKRYTWRRNTPLQQSRLDYWLISAHMLYNMKTTNIKAGFKTDHSLIQISFECNSSEKRGPGFWKFNSSLLTDDDFCAYIRGIIEKYSKTYAYLSDHTLKWDLIKMEIRTATIAYSKTQASLKRQHEKKLHAEINALEEIINFSPADDIMARHAALQTELENIYV